MRYNTGRESNTVTRRTCLDVLGEIMENAPRVPPAKSEVATVTSRLACGHEDNDKDLWSSGNVARAQSEDPDVGPVVDQLLREWKTPIDKEL